MTIYLSVLSTLWVILALVFIQAAREVRWVARARAWDAERAMVVRELVWAARVVVEEREAVLVGPHSREELKRYANHLWQLSNRCDDLKEWEDTNPPPKLPQLFGKPSLILFRH